MASVDSDKKRVLGRGLASLIPDTQGTPSATPKRQYFECDIEKILPNTYQPRKIFNKDALQDLAKSIKANGILQPLVVRVRDGHYELIAGERRWRAAQKAGLKKVPVVVKEINDEVFSLEMALIENIQRESLNCIEEAIAFQQLIDQFQLSHDDIANRVGKSRAAVANTVRLLKLPASIREDITSDKLTMGHARALLSLENAQDQLELRDQVVKGKLSVRETEKRVNAVLRSQKAMASSPKEPDVHIQALEDRIRRHYGTKARIVGTEKRGFIQLSYSNQEDLNRIADRLLGVEPPQSV